MTTTRFQIDPNKPVATIRLGDGYHVLTMPNGSEMGGTNYAALKRYASKHGWRAVTIPAPKINRDCNGGAL